MKINQALKSCRDYLSSADINDPAFEADCIMQSVLGFSRTDMILHGDAEVTKQQADKIAEISARRINHEPLQYILGEWSFMGFDLCVGEGVLIPRDDTEVAAGLCIDYLKNKRSAKAIDLCAGSGAIAIALNKIAHTEVCAVELSPKALPYLIKNISLNTSTVKTFEGDIFECHSQFNDGEYDLIVSNPPYIKTEEISALQAEVQFEPKMALDGGSDGYSFYRAIVSLWSVKLKKGGALVFELGENQFEYVAKLMENEGFTDIKIEKDLGGIERAIIGIK